VNTNWRHRLRRYHRRYGWWLDAASLSLLLTTALAAAYAAYRFFGQDFRGYYGAARLVLQGGNPYDYAQLAPVLFQLDGRVGNNPFYYAPWWALMFTPLAALLSYAPARAVWLGLNLVLGGIALALSLLALGWRPTGWRRWLAYWGALYLFGWICLRYEQSGIFLFLVLAVILWALQTGRDRLAGLTLPLLLTKPNVTFLPLAVLLAVFWSRSDRRALLWAGIGLAGLLLLSTLAIPGWYEPILRGELPNGLTQVLDGPEEVTGIRINTTLLDWLKSFGLPDPVNWGIWGLAVVASLGLLIRAWRHNVDTVYLVLLSVVLGFVITPYTLQYDYPLMVPAFLWVLWKLPRFLRRSLRRSLRRVPGWQRWIGPVVLAFLFSVLLWEGPISDGYWIALGLAGLLIWLGQGEVVESGS